jgi:uncharacterized protein (TIGR02265 family)
MTPRTEVRGLAYQMVKDIFPHLEGIVGAELAAHFENVDGEAWYDAGPYLKTIRYLIEHISPQVMVLIGNQLIEAFKGVIRRRGINTTRELAEALPELTKEIMRGENAGQWAAEEYAPGRAVIRETGLTANTDFGSGVIKAGLELVGAYNVRVTVIDDRAAGAEANRYLVEWIDPAEAT